MKNVTTTILMVVAILFMASGQGFGWTQFKDGGVHNISSTINDDVWVDYLAPGKQTTVNILDGGGFGWGYLLQGWSNGIINLSGGDVPIPYLNQESHMNMTGGSVSNQVTMLDNTTLLYSGGNINYLLMMNNSQCTINGSHFVLDGENVDYGYTIHSVLGGMWQGEPIRRLTGTLANGDNFLLGFRMDGPNTSITLVPEPTTMLLLGLGGLLLRSRKK